MTPALWTAKLVAAELGVANVNACVELVSPSRPVACQVYDTMSPSGSKLSEPSNDRDGNTKALLPATRDSRTRLNVLPTYASAPSSDASSRRASVLLDDTSVVSSRSVAGVATITARGVR